ncbi:hypothetical protein AGR1B_pTi0172 [Agrobacterium fabacearum S56]|uniref:Uncharacterized protein n=1 Tax=Agrobacterium deltaense Zutra 3/1 TaxID=1183427 RepID=A0A1S7S4V4_9HYPH|nr:hypothetical protein AGR1B_pTi0172 [Agrobacterium fabacearum S56]CUX62663.1 hypothetical protein AGR7C_pTi0006 [Agrobacterium deltaense Zutra 3/1]
MADPPENPQGIFMVLFVVTDLNTETVTHLKGVEPGIDDGAGIPQSCVFRSEIGTLSCRNPFHPQERVF